MTRMMLKTACVAIVLMAMLGGTSAFASSTGLHLRVMDVTTGTVVVLVADEDFVPTAPHTNPDTFPLPGVVTFSGSVGAWSVSISGMSKPVLGSSTMSLNVAAIGGVGDLLFELSDTDFLPTGPGNLSALVGGTNAASATTSFTMFKDEGNDLFGCGELAPACPGAPMLTFGPFGGGAYSDSDSISHGALSDYSMTLMALLHHGTAGEVSSLDIEMTNTAAVPEPTTVILLGGGLMALGLASLRRRS